MSVWFIFCKGGAIYILALIISIIATAFTAMARGPLCSRVFLCEGGSSCSQPLYENDIDVLLSKLEHLEGRIQNMISTASSAFSDNTPKNQHLNSLMARLAGEIPYLEALQDRALSEGKVEREVLDSLVISLDSLETSLIRSLSSEMDFENPKNGANNLSGTEPNEYYKITFDPSLAVANKIYTVPTHNGQTLKIVFSESLVKEIFYSSDQELLRCLSRALRLADKGVFGAGYAGVGIKRLYGNNQIVEIRTRGLSAYFRIYGYLNGDEIHFVKWTKSSKHNSFLSSRVMSSIKTLSVVSISN
jgi:hypothetical protein